MTNRLAWIATLVTGLFMMAQYFIKTDAMDAVYTTLLDYYQIIFAVSMIVGGVGLLKQHSLKVQRSSQQRGYSLITIAAILFMVIAAVISGTGAASPYQWAFNNLQAPMQATTFSRLAFFVASAAYRGFRVKSTPAFILALAAVIVLVGKSGFGEMISQQLPAIAGWVLNNPSTAAKRGILIGVGIGSVATALRVILGIERSYR
ncbi:MAG: hypothetical protein E4G91_06035 [Candidatus Zixiibacteriota bacterium]|nr:MAG: hypothetical protein E4G91_06035 [candidate division Zixibacteria bacterium]